MSLRGDGVVPEQLHRAWRVIERVFQRIQIAAKVRRQFQSTADLAIKKCPESQSGSGHILLLACWNLDKGL